MLTLSFQARENTPQCTPRPMIVKVKQLRLPKLWCAYRGPRGAHWYETEVYHDRMRSMDDRKSATETVSGCADNAPATAYKSSEVVCAIFVHGGWEGVVLERCSGSSRPRAKSQFPQRSSSPVEVRCGRAVEVDDDHAR